MNNPLRSRSVEPQQPAKAFTTLHAKRSFSSGLTVDQPGGWRTVATYRVPTEGGGWGTAADSDPKERFVFHHAGLAGSGSSGYIDEVILRDRDNTSGWVGASDGTLEERFFHLHNWRHDVIALGKSDGTLVERVKYSSYGVATRLDPADYNQDGFIDFFDDDGFDADYTNTNALADFDYSGTVNATDSTTWTTSYLAGNITARGALSTTDAATGVNNRAGYAGYTFSPATQQYHVRHRAYDPLVGAWGERDPMEYVDGVNLYEYVASDPVGLADSTGLQAGTEPNSDCKACLIAMEPYRLLPVCQQMQYLLSQTAACPRRCWSVAVGFDALTLAAILQSCFPNGYPGVLPVPTRLPPNRVPGRRVYSQAQINNAQVAIQRGRCQARCRALRDIEDFICEIDMNRQLVLCQQNYPNDAVGNLACMTRAFQAREDCKDAVVLNFGLCMGTCP
jgi:RHS repeat-associated protein